MDIVLIVILIFGFFRGYLKGFVSTIFSLLSVFVAIFVAWKFLDIVLPILDGFCGDHLRKLISETLTSFVEGTFDNLETFKLAIENSKLNIFDIFEKLFVGVSFDGELTAGQILSPILTDLLLKVVGFVGLFLFSMIVLNLIKFLINKFIKACGLSGGNKILGGFLGVLKGFLLFLLMFFILSSLANVLLNQALLNFVNNGVVSKWLYDKFYNQIILLF